MSDEIAVARVARTGALIPLHNGNRRILDQSGVVETKAVKDKETGRLVEVDGAEHTEMVAASNDLQRIGQALLANKRQREQLLTSALKLPNAEEYLQQLDVYDGSEDSQYIDPDSLHPNNAGLPEQAVQVMSPDDIKQAYADTDSDDADSSSTSSGTTSKKKTASKTSSKSGSGKSNDSDELSDL